jgi:hypothetical protein
VIEALQLPRGSIETSRQDVGLQAGLRTGGLRSPKRGDLNAHRHGITSGEICQNDRIVSIGAIIAVGINSNGPREFSISNQKPN